LTALCWPCGADIVNSYAQKQPFFREGELDAFFAIMRRDLPSTFRVNESNPFASVVKRKLVEYQRSMSVVTVARQDSDPVDVQPPAPIPWYPLELSQDGISSVWVFEMAKRLMKKVESVESFRSFLVHMNDLGTITRQEAVRSPFLSSAVCADSCPCRCRCCRRCSWMCNRIITYSICALPQAQRLCDDCSIRSHGDSM